MSGKRRTSDRRVCIREKTRPRLSVNTEDIPKREEKKCGGVKKKKERFFQWTEERVEEERERGGIGYVP